MRKPCIFRSSYGSRAPVKVYWWERVTEDHEEDDPPMVKIYGSVTGVCIDEVPMNLIESVPAHMVEGDRLLA